MDFYFFIFFAFILKMLSNEYLKYVVWHTKKSLTDLNRFFKLSNGHFALFLTTGQPEKCPAKCPEYIN